MKVFVKDFCGTVQAIVVIFGLRVDNAVLYYWIANPPFAAYSFLFLSDFLPFHTLDNENFRQRYLRNLVRYSSHIWYGSC